jgi:hypothetical protein
MASVYQMTQVLVAFVATAYKIWLCCIAKIRIDHLRSPGKSTPSYVKWSFSLGTVTTSFSGRRIVTSISVILPGFLSLAQASTLYHWQTVANLAWFSAFMHVTTLAALRGEDRFNKTIAEAPHTYHGNSGHNADLCTYSLGWTNSWGTATLPAYDDQEVEGPMPLAFPAWCLYRSSILWSYSSINDSRVSIRETLVMTYY